MESVEVKLKAFLNLVLVGGGLGEKRSVALPCLFNSEKGFPLL
jgi:hypothetical protein